MNIAQAPAHALSGAVESDVAGGQEFGDAFGSAAPQQRAYACHQLKHRKRLDDIIVSAGREPAHALGFVAAAGHYDDRQGARLFARPQPNTDFKSGDAWQRPIEKEEV